MSIPRDDSLLFIVEYFDPAPRLKRQYLLKLFLDGMQVEMVDLKNKKMFLKKSPCPSHMTPQDFFIGGKVLLYARDLEIIDYGDLKTREKLQHQLQPSVVVLPFELHSVWGKVIDELLGAGLGIVKIKSFVLPENVSGRICSILRTTDARGLLSGGNTTLVVMVQGEDGVQRSLDICSALGCPFVSSSGIEAADLADALLNTRGLPTSATMDNCTCCIVKPHAIKAKLLGKIMNLISSQGYEISAATTVYFDRTSAEEFLEVYKGVVPEYPDHVNELAGGMCVALEVRAEDAVNTFRQSAGPWDVEMAKVLRPDSIRGLYGIDRVRNAVHCTDLAQDAVPEVQYCFSIVQQ
jgi:nucleoside-diphosphate kinase